MFDVVDIDHLIGRNSEMGYTHLTVHEREIISRMKYAGASQAAIAAQIGRSAGTISRELKRNRSLCKVIRYSPHQAHRMARERRKEARNQAPRKIEERRLLGYMKARLERMVTRTDCWATQK